MTVHRMNSPQFVPNAQPLTPLFLTPPAPVAALGADLASPVEVPQLALLRVLAARPALSQRELSQALGLSLGKTHYVLHALLDKGLVKARNFSRSGHKLGYAYLLTPAGLREKLRMTRQFLGHKEAEFEQLRATIAALRAEVGEALSGAGSP